MKNKIGILTLPFDPNYGWILQLWALYNFLNNNGYDVVVIDRRWNDPNPSFVKDLKRWLYYNIFCHHFTTFFKKEFKRSPVLRNEESLKRFIQEEKIGAIVVGSDQVWRIENTRGVGLNFFLDFVEGNNVIKKVAYAASFGIDQWNGTEIETNKVSKLLNAFDLITVREMSGVNLCKDVFNVKAEQVLDPTMLSGESKYAPLLDTTNKKRKQLVTYLLDNNANKLNIVNYIANELGDSVKHLYTKKHSHYSFYLPVEKWLNEIKNADFVVVDSFHGMVFSILFNKPFLVIGNINRGMTRFESLLSDLRLTSRLIDENIAKPDIIKIINCDIDYAAVFERLEVLRGYSRELLLNSLS